MNKHNQYVIDICTRLHLLSEDEVTKRYLELENSCEICGSPGEFVAHTYESDDDDADCIEYIACSACFVADVAENESEAQR